MQYILYIGQIQIVSYRKKRTFAVHKNQLFAMENFLIALVLGLFAAMLFINFYFRVKVLQTYKKLVQNRVEFGAAHLFNSERMAKEIYPKYPNQREDIAIFVKHIKYSINIASLLIALITAFGGILMWYRKGG
jgi:hypothetical protein